MMKIKFIIFLLLIVLFSCVKKVGTNPEIAYSDKALLDSTKNQNYKYYKGKDSLLSGSHGPHGTFKLRFNSIAFKVLTDNGKLPVNGKFPEGSFIVKDVYKNGSIDVYAYMYKRGGSWLWGEAHSNGIFVATAKDGASVCLPCHSQTGNRDNVVAFNFY
jgi:hypothetical protein